MRVLGLMAPMAVGVAAASMFVASDASACGGCFVPQVESTVVTGHRMALSISTTQTVLWDQIQYSGDPGEFAWVLPVKPGAYVEVSTDAWFETLEAATAVQVVQPQVQCRQPFSFGCGSSAADSAGFEGSSTSGGPAVDVVHRGTVGPYDTVTLSTETPGALNDWLAKASFAVDPSTQPVIDAYVAEGFDFIALKLQPDKGVREMKPVRVVSPGAAPVLPLRMVAVGSGPTVAVTLFVIAEGRWAAENFTNTRVPQDLLAWDFADSTSNYGELRAQVLKASDGGSAWLTSYARQGSLLSPVSSPVQTPFGFGGNIQYGVDVNNNVLDTVAEAYLNQGVLNKEAATDSGAVNESQCASDFSILEATVASSGATVVDPCPMGVPPDDPTCAQPDPNDIDARGLQCGALDDLAVALTGTHPRDVWLTRLEAELPQAALKADLTLKPADAQETVEHFITARIAVNAEQVCGSFVPPAVWPSRGGAAGGTGALAWLGLGGLAIASALARRLSRSTWATGASSGRSGEARL